MNVGGKWVSLSIDFISAPLDYYGLLVYSYMNNSFISKQISIIGNFGD
jgi:hypothetical protein